MGHCSIHICSLSKSSFWTQYAPFFPFLASYHSQDCCLQDLVCYVSLGCLLMAWLLAFLAQPSQGHYCTPTIVPGLYLALIRLQIVGISMMRESGVEEFYPDTKDKIPSNMPEPRGPPVKITCFLNLLVTQIGNNMYMCSGPWRIHEGTH